MSVVLARLNENNVEIPDVTAPAAAYVPYVISGKQVFISGQLPFHNGAISQTGHLGKNVSLEQGQETAKICGINLLAHLKNACGGNLDKVKQVVRLEILVSATPDFNDPHIVANGVSELIKLAFGDEKGSHARVAYGVSSLPLGAAVEVAAIFEL